MRPNTRAMPASRAHDARAAVRPATIVELRPDGRIAVRARADGERTRQVVARLARIPGYRPNVGDRVLLAGGGAELYAIAVLHSSRADALELADGAVAAVAGDALELRDPDGRLLFRYADGNAEVLAPARDLKLAAPRGRVVLEAATDVTVHAARDLTQHAGRRLSLDAARSTQQLELSPERTHLAASRLDVEAKESRVATGRATIIARTISTTAEQLAQRVERYELVASSVVEKARDVLRETSGLAQWRLGRAKTYVAGRFSLHSRTTDLSSREETRVDGERILLG